MVLSAFFSVLFSIFWTSLLISMFYLQKYIFPGVEKDIYRISLMILQSILSFLILFIIGALEPFYIFGDIFMSFKFLFTTVLLFLGPICQEIIEIVNGFSEISFISYIFGIIGQLLRNFPWISVAIAPLLEEILYRVFNINMWMSCGISMKKSIFLSPLVFGLSHFHHFFETDRRRFGIRRLFIQTIVQCCYTTVFGWWASFAWCRTHSLFAVFSLHAFCNFMQFPDFIGAIQWRYPKQRIVIIVSYIVGIIAFIFSTIKISRY